MELRDGDGLMECLGSYVVVLFLFVYARVSE